MQKLFAAVFYNLSTDLTLTSQRLNAWFKCIGWVWHCSYLIVVRQWARWGVSGCWGKPYFRVIRVAIHALYKSWKQRMINVRKC